MPPLALFLDFDGLICDTERAARRSWEETWAECALTFPDELWQRMAGRSGGEAIALAALAEELGRPVDEALRSHRFRRKRELSAQEALRPGVAALLDAAGERGIPTAVVSSSPAEWVEGHLARLGVRDSFAFVLTGDEVARHKPAPDLYLAALARMDVAAKDALALEDSPVGVRSARAAGVWCVAVPSSGAAADRLESADAVVGVAGAYLLEADWHRPQEVRNR